MAIYQIGGQSIHSDDPALSELLANIYSSRERPLCLCRTPGIEMYVAKVDEKYLIKRMPNSGSGHAPACDSYEPPPELSGLGQVIGSAIQENPDEGTTALKFDFALSKGASRSAPAPSGKETDSVKTDGNKLTLRGTLHYLWEEAGFNRWAPTMAGKRSWYVIRKYLLQAAEDKTAKGASLAGMLYMPESFNAEKKNEITQRRLAQMMRIATPEKGTRRLMLVVGEVKELAQSRYGHKIVLKHLPDCHFMMNDDIYKRLLKRFEVELGLWDALEGTHLMMIGTFSIGATGVASLEEVALMCVTENWIPFESTFEKMALDALTQQNRRFMKGMRYNLPSTRPLACAVASDTEPEPTAMYVVPPGASEDYAAAVDELIAESKLPSWKWVAGEAPMPALPALPEHGR
ncbi:MULTISPECIES: DUF1173 domain-containing protein [Burkholderiales]|uniref:DUF1173 domain-containing protein n=1 Tax=Burkholderiales TaxID=80840 RepID=UPI0000DCA45A|nr:MULTISPECIES: DUF1173 domain-containing protein [Burkholderiales]ABM44338.1 protein of unknown function DUF1173 [Acidovorax sp. JS42]TXH14829.1 MAG: DUF1173 domain-containing protein [Gammaproteobacteria bacterium]